MIRTMQTIHHLFAPAPFHRRPPDVRITQDIIDSIRAQCPEKIKFVYTNKIFYICSKFVH